MFKHRFFYYGLFILVAVGGSVWVLTNPMRFLGGGHFRAAPAIVASAADKGPWAPSPELTAAANEGFSVESARAEKVSLARTDPGSSWPCFNGARRDNKSDATGLLAEWPKEGPPLAWVARGVGAGYSSVSLADGRLYTMGNKGDTEAVIALDTGTGEKIWSTPIAWASQPSAGEGPRSTPTIHGEGAYAMGANGDLACLDARTGEVRWQRNIIKDFGGPIPTWGICESVLIDEGRLICTPGGEKATLAALDPASGETVWTSMSPDKDRPGYASPIVTEVNGVRQYVQFTASGTIGVRASDGQYLWRDNTASNSAANCSSPLASQDFVFSASNYGIGGALVKLTASDSNVTSELVYKTNDMKCHHGDMVIVDALIYGSNDPGILTCLELETGKVRWQSRGPGKGSVTFADGRIYARGEKGSVTLVEAGTDKYRERGQFEQPHRSDKSAWSHPVVAAGHLFLRDQDVLLCYDVRAK